MRRPRRVLVERVIFFSVTGVSDSSIRGNSTATSNFVVSGIGSSVSPGTLGSVLVSFSGSGGVSEFSVSCFCDSSSLGSDSFSLGSNSFSLGSALICTSETDPLSTEVGSSTFWRLDSLASIGWKH